jgi:hypothetical protein
VARPVRTESRLRAGRHASKITGLHVVGNAVCASPDRMTLGRRMAPDAFPYVILLTISIGKLLLRI